MYKLKLFGFYTIVESCCYTLSEYVKTLLCSKKFYFIIIMLMIFKCISVAVCTIILNKYNLFNSFDLINILKLLSYLYFKTFTVLLIFSVLGKQYKLGFSYRLLGYTHVQYINKFSGMVELIKLK